MEPENLEECAHCSKSTTPSNTPKWRRDFPIEWEGDHYVSRREMVKFLTLGSLLITVGNWITVAIGRVRPREVSVAGGRYVGSAAALDQMGSILFRFPTDNDPCIAVRAADGKIHAYSQVCTHLSCAVVYDKRENALVCPCHRGYFNIEEGMPMAGPPTRALPRVLVQQEGDKLFATELLV
ncbi:MAG TPA: Rieske 2Fe-2S domain-containing protein [Clostridia bacterium]|nr:Rieske 2Fe-2S domain-containing protein [Clostridia bacterium]